jgi:hypothetical protein
MKSLNWISFLNNSKMTIDNLNREGDYLEKLAQNSVEAVVPAIGVQKHWKEAQAKS